MRQCAGQTEARRGVADTCEWEIVLRLGLWSGTTTEPGEDSGAVDNHSRTVAQARRSQQAVRSAKKIHDQVTPLDRPLSPGEGRGGVACNAQQVNFFRPSASAAVGLNWVVSNPTLRLIRNSIMKRLLLLCFLAVPLQAKPAIRWEPWSDDLFARARSEHRFVLLDLEAVWCHWCHVMDEMTYSDEHVIALINRRYLAVRVDQDSRPDLSNRYEDYGWPATIVFAADRSEIVKRSGYIPPMPMASMLQAIIDDPSPGPSVVKETPPMFANDATLAPPLRAQLEKTYNERYDAQHGGWGFVHKYLDPPTVHYPLARAPPPDPAPPKLARQPIAAV